MQRTTAGIAILALVLICTTAGPAAAGLVQAGQAVSLNSSDFVAPAGALVDQRTSAFAIQYGKPEPSIGFSGQLAGTLHSAVYRDSGGGLSFLYDIDLQNSPGVSAAEASSLTVSSFKGFTTQVSGALDFEQLVRASRSANGAQIRLFSDSPGLGGPPTLVVRTNATAYNTAGQASYAAADEVNDVNGSSRLAAGTATIEGLFHPIFDSAPDPGPRPEPAPIPLPPAAYSGLGVLLGIGVITVTRRAYRRGSADPFPSESKRSL